MSSREQKRRVLQQLHDMGFQAQEISVAIRENGYNLERCTDFLVSRQQSARPRLFVGQEVWIYSVDNEDWVPGNIVSITKQLVSIIFSGHDFRWLEKESDLFCIQDEKPEPFLNSSKISGTGVGQGGIPNARKEDEDGDAIRKQSGGYNNESNNIADGNENIANMNDGNGNPNHGNNGYQPPRDDEMDYHVRFTESVLGLELYSDEDGYNCIVGRCVSNIARANVTPGSQIVQVNDRWLANFRFEEIRDAVKQAAKSPPLNVNFRIKKSILNAMKPNGGFNPNVMNVNQPPNNTVPSYSNTSPEDPNARHLAANEKKPAQRAAADDAVSGHSISNHEEKQWRPSQPMNQPFVNEDDTFEGHMTLEQAERLQSGDHIDNRDDVGRFLLASIVDKRGTQVKIHYEGWNSKWDKWYDITSDLRKFARARSISRKPNTRFPQLKIRDYVDINPLERHPGWRPGQIRRMDKYSGQSQIVYKEDGQEFLYWAHLNNPEEIAPFMTKSAETIAKQQQAHQQQQHNSNIQNGNNHLHMNNYNSNSGSGANNTHSYGNGFHNSANSGSHSNSNVPNQTILANHAHKQSMTISQSSSKRRQLPPTLQGRSLPPKPQRKPK